MKATSPELTQAQKDNLLLQAAQRGDYESAALLLQQHANPNIADREGFLPIDYAAAAGHDDITNLLAPLSLPHPAAQEEHPQEILQQLLLSPAAQEEHPQEVLQQLLFSPAPQDYPVPQDHDRFDTPPYYSQEATRNLFCAVKALDTRAVSDALNNRANPNRSDMSGRTPLHHITAAVVKGPEGCKRNAITKMLLKSGASLSATQQYTRKTPLHLAAYNNFTNFLVIAEQAGVPLDQETLDMKDIYGKTAMITAALRGNYLFTKSLEKYGANKELRDPAGRTVDDIIGQRNARRRQWSAEQQQKKIANTLCKGYPPTEPAPGNSAASSSFWQNHVDSQPHRFNAK